MLNLYIQYMSVTVCKIRVLLGQHWHRVVWLNCNRLLLCQSALGHRQSMCWWRRRWISDISIQSIIYLQERSAALASAPNLASLIGSSQVSPSLLLAAREDQSFIDPVKAGTSTSVYKVQSWTCLWSLMKMPLTPAKYRKHFLFSFCCCFFSGVTRRWWAVYQTEEDDLGKLSLLCQHGQGEARKATEGDEEADNLISIRRRKGKKINLSVFLALLINLRNKRSFCFIEILVAR